MFGAASGICAALYVYNSCDCEHRACGLLIMHIVCGTQCSVKILHEISLLKLG